MLKTRMPKFCKQSSYAAPYSWSKKILRSEARIASITTSLLYPRVLPKHCPVSPRLLPCFSGKGNSDLGRPRQHSGLVGALPGSINHHHIFMLSARCVLGIYLQNGCPKIRKYKYLLGQEISDGNSSTHWNQYFWHLNADSLRLKNSKILTNLRLNQKKLNTYFQI